MKNLNYLANAAMPIRKLFIALVFFSSAISSADLAKGKASEYKRIVSAGGSITEIVHSLGLLPNVIAVDTSSLYPDSVKSLPQVGYFRSLGAEGLLSLSPDLLVVARGAGPDAVLRQVENSGVTVRQFEQSVYTLESWQKLVSEIGQFFDRDNKANELIDKALTQIDEAQSQRRYKSGQINAIALMNSGQRGPTVAGKNTVPDLLMSLAGIDNLAKDIDSYKPFSSELLASSQVDLIMVPHHNLEAMGGVDGVCAEKSIKLATENGCNVLVMDALLMLGFGARIDQATRQVIEFGNQL